MMSAKGFPGSLVEAIRAGMRTMVFRLSIMELAKGAAKWCKPPLHYCGGAEKALVSAPDDGSRGFYLHGQL